MNRHSLNAAILSMAPAFEARPFAPSTLAELMRAPRLVGWDGASDKTIYRDPKVNHAFRAWHDAEHVAGAHAFDLEGEAATCRAQIAGLLKRYPQAPQWLLDIVRREVIGQVEYQNATGHFPMDQEAFHA